MQITRTMTLAFVLFELFPLELCHSQKSVCCLTWKPFKISSQNFVWISINIRRRAKCINHNSCIYTFGVISLGVSLVNINVRWMYNTIWHQKGGRHLCFCRKQILVEFWFIIILGGCTAGYYCPTGESTANRLACIIGHYCPANSSNPILCASGEYQDQTGQSSCKTCPGGYYCDNSGGVVTINSSISCPTGYYCPPGKLLAWKIYHIYLKYWDTLTLYHTCPKIRTSPL